MSASFSLALDAAKAATAGQHYPQSTLYVLATPIGNLADISLRGLHLLNLAETLACEDTRHTQQMLGAYGIHKTAAQWLAVHQHNELEASHSVIERLHSGQRVVYVSDAGTPGVSDPGARLVASVVAQGLRVMPLPGASSVTALLSVAGCTTPSGGVEGFAFVGFLPTKNAERSKAMLALAQEPRAAVLLEAPHRIEALAKDLATLGTRYVTVGRELTKQFEEIATLPAQDLSAWLSDSNNRTRGEFTLLLHPLAVDDQAEHRAEDIRVLSILLKELPLKTAVQLAAEITQQPRNTLYAQALALKDAL